MQVSLIVPVYNACDYVTDALQSALEQPEIQEILLVEDGSTDDSLSVCQEFSDREPRITLLRHPGGENRGAGASRNLGIYNAKCAYIAFLDADDIFLPGRFDVCRKLFSESPGVDGVYNAIGYFCEDAVSQLKWNAHGGQELTTLTQAVVPEKLFDVLVGGGSGHFSLDGLTVKKNFFERCGYFDEALRLHQDSALMVKMAATGRLIAGSLSEPVALRRVHPGNRFLSDSYNAHYTNKLLWASLFLWSLNSDLGFTQKAALYRKYIKSETSYLHSQKKHVSMILSCMFQTIRHPLFSAFVFRKFLLNRLRL